MAFYKNKLLHEGILRIACYTKARMYIYKNGMPQELGTTDSIRKNWVFIRRHSTRIRNYKEAFYRDRIPQECHFSMKSGVCLTRMILFFRHY